MPHDDIDHIPSIVPTRDAEHYPPGGKAGRRTAARGKSRSTADSMPVPARSGTGAFARLVITISLVVAAVACAWAWQLQQQSEQANVQLKDYAVRIADLEDRLSDTDEGANQSAAALSAKIKELYSEVDKLWASAWRTNKAKIEALEGSSASREKKLAGTTKSLAAAEAQLKSAAKDIARLKSVANDLERLVASTKVNQAEVERVADAMNRINLDIAKLNKRVKGNEEWIGSINAFRKQVNTNLVELRAAVRGLQSSLAPAPTPGYSPTQVPVPTP